MAGHMELEVDVRGRSAKVRTGPRPFSILVLGDFGGAADSPAAQPGSSAARRIRRLDLDSRDAVFASFESRLGLDLGAGTTELRFSDIEDFHPDRLYAALPEFQQLRSLRRRLLNTETAASTLQELLTQSGPLQVAPAEQSEAKPEPVPEEDAGQMFERLLGAERQTRRETQQAAARTGLERLIHDLVAPHIVKDPDPRVDTAVGSVDAASADLMRNILHHRRFLRLEASWRGLYGLATELELDESLQLYACDIRREELLAALPDPGQPLQSSPLFGLLVDRQQQGADAAPWTVIVGDYDFGPEPEDIALLTALGAAAAANGGVFLGGARPGILGCQSIAELSDSRYWSTADDGHRLWDTLRASPIADRVGLAIPRVLGRLPYGEQTDPVDAFPFEELVNRVHEDYLWINPAYACARVLAENFTQDGWNMDPGDHLGLGTLPAHHYEDEGEVRLQPCAELLLSESTMVAMLERGLIPVISYRNQNTAMLARLQSIASPPAPLAGPWI